MMMQARSTPAMMSSPTAETLLQPRELVPISTGREPWSDMVEVTPLPDAVRQWLAAWQAVFNDRYPGQGIDGATPTIFINPNYVPPRIFRDVPADPQAYAVYGEFGVPMTINVSSMLTKRPVSIAAQWIPGIGDRLIASLNQYDIDYIDEVAGGWVQLISDATGQPPDYSRYLIGDAVAATNTINSSRGYLDGVDERVAGILTQLGLTDDVALANADRAALSQALGSEGFANRLIEQAREAVPPSAWSLDQVGFTQGQIEALAQQGIVSKGEYNAYVAAANDAQRNTLASSLSVNTQFLAAVQTTVTSQMAASSVAQAPLVDLTALTGVNAVVRDRLIAQNIMSVDQLATADPAQVATATGLSATEAGDLVAQAKTLSSQNVPVERLAPVSSDTATALQAMNIRTVGDLATKNVSDIAAAFGGDVTRANAVLQGVRMSLGLMG
jgi:predicted flap endonuclease-1-like 5' DNA nuclease